MQNYLTLQDFNFIIQPGQLEYQLVQNNIQTLWFSTNVAISEAYSLLEGRYELTNEFQDTGTWSFGATYTPSNRIILDYATYSNGITYLMGQCIILPNINIYDNTNYDAIGEAYCLTGTTSWLGTNSQLDSNWTDIGEQYTFYNVKYPAPIFDYKKDYQLNDVVFWAGFTWSCVSPTPLINQTYAEQFVSINEVPRNPFPTDFANRNGTFWITSSQSCLTPTIGETYSIAGTSSIGTYTIFDTLPTNKNFWNHYDNRSKLMMTHIMQIALYYLHMNIQPTNVPELRKEGYKNAINYFKDLIEGRRYSPILLKQPDQGMTVRFGGNVRKTRFW